MSTLTVIINADNAAFEDDRNAELSRILRKLADRLEFVSADFDGGQLIDINGNSVGWWKVSAS